MKLSIIIPAYNAAEYIAFCLSTCSAQDLQPSEYEMIVVNDGSTDNTPQIVATYAGKHPNTRLVNQENKGNGAARNTGVANANGAYILFLDSDDYIARDTLGTLVRLVLEYDLDFLGFSSKNVSDSSQVEAKVPPEEVGMDEVCSGIAFIGTYNYKAEVWWYLVKRSFYTESGVRFFDRKFVQDSYLTPTLISKSKRAAFIPLDVHRYRQSMNSITRKKSREHLLQHFNDLTFSVKQLYELRHVLIAKGVHNKDALGRLHVKQQRYVLIIIVRFIKSSLEITLLKEMLAECGRLEAYPMDKFMSTSDYRSPVYQLLTFIFNRKYLLFPALKMYRALLG